MDSIGLVNHGLALVCEACESEIDLDDAAADRGVCRPCGVAFLIDVDAPVARTA